MEASSSGITPRAYTSPISSPEPDFTEPEAASFHGRITSSLVGSADPFLPQSADSPERDELAQPLPITTATPRVNLQPILTMTTTRDAGTGVTTVLPSSSISYMSIETSHETVDERYKNIRTEAPLKKSGREYQAQKRTLKALKEEEITKQRLSLTRIFNNNISTLSS